MARILVTGGTGFVGASLAARRAARGDAVHVVARPGSSAARLAELGVEVAVHRVRSGDRDGYAAVFEAVRPQSVVHLAAATRRRDADDLSDAAESVREDLENLLAVVTAAATARSRPEVFLRGGSLAEYGWVSAPPDETRREAPADAYAAATVAGTHYLRMLQRRLPFPAMTARFGLVYGATQSERFLIAELVRKAVDGVPTRILRPSDRRDVIFVEDALDAVDALLAAPRAGAVVNVGAGLAPTMAEVAALVAEAAGDPALVEFSAQARDDARHLMLDSGLARREWGWTARTPLRTGLGQVVAWRRAAAARRVGEVSDAPV